uniref:Transposase MuDR plant domain-containing protein n=1 Tax=Fagus sylvatica TaxID=28930 RepID=A0A2N9EIL4_FAGSY
MIIEEEDSDDDVEVDDEELDDMDRLAIEVYTEGKQPFDEDMPYVDEEDRRYWEGAGCTSNLLQLVGVTTNNINMEIPTKADVSECMESDDEIGNVFWRAVREVNVRMGKDLKWSKNDPNRVVVVCKKKRCKYKVYASNVKGEKSFQIKQMYLKHSCARSYKNTQVTSQWLANKYLETIRVNPEWLLKAFKYQVMNDFKVDVTKYKVYRAKRKAFEIIHGDYKESYGRLWDYAATLQKTNVGSCVVVKVVRTIPTSSSHIPNGCQLLSAIGRDGNDNIYPIAVAAVEQENNEAWTSLWEAAVACTETEYLAAMEELKKIDEAAYNYLDTVDQCMWSRAYFISKPRTDLLVNNLSKSFNSYIMDARDKPLVAMMEIIQEEIDEEIPVEKGRDDEV